MPEAAIPLVAEEAIGAGTTLTAEELAAQQLLAQQQAAAALQAQQAAEAAQAAQAAQTATNQSVLNTIAQTPVSSAGSGISSLASGANPAAGGLSSLVNTTGGPTTWEQIFNQGQNIAEGSTELGKVANASSTVPFSSGLTGTVLPVELTEGLPVLDSATQFPSVTDEVLRSGMNNPASSLNNTYTGPGSMNMNSFGELVNPFATPPVAPTVAPPVVEPVLPAPTPVPAMPPPEYGFTGAPPVAEPVPVEPVEPAAETAPVKPQTPAAEMAKNADAGIKALAREVGATSAFNTAPTLTQYGASAPTSTLPTSFNPAAPMANPTYAQSGLQGLQTNLSGPLGSNLTPSVTQAVNPAGADQFTQMQVRSALTGEGMNPGMYQETVAKTPFSTVGSTPTQFAGNTSNFGANPVEQYNAYDKSFGPAQRIPTETGGLPGAMTGASIPLPTELGGTATATASEGNILQSAWSDFTKMPLKDKLLTGIMANTAYQMANPPKAYEKPKYKSTWNGSNYTGYQPVQPTPYTPQYAGGGLADLGGYSDGGRMLKGLGDGMSDDIPATIANKQPARLANEEFVIPADVVSHLGNGSSEAGAKQLYKMMDRVRQARTGNKKQGKQINPEKYLA